MIEQLENLPSISFIDDLTLAQLQEMMVSAYERRYRELTEGKAISLQKSDPEMLKIYAASVVLYQLAQYVERAGRQNMLSTSYGPFLDNLAALKGVTRMPAQKAKTTARFMVPMALASAVTIPKGTKLTNDSGITFETDEVAEIKPGAVSVDVSCNCTEAGEIGSGLPIGSLNVLVNKIPYVQGVTNVTITEGGSSEESDESLAERVYIAPSAYAVAGPRDAYIYHAKSYSPKVGSVNVSSPSPCDVEVRVLLSDGSLPSVEFLNDLSEHLSADTVRPLTDRVTVMAPTVTTFDIEVKYFIARSNQNRAVSIQDAVKNAVSSFVSWQTSEIGRDINPSELIRRMVNAGAKRAEVTAPTFTAMEPGSVAQAGTIAITYGGLEND